MRNMQRKKVCFIGASAVGKTSLVAACSGAALPGEYESTLGVRITKAVVTTGERLKELVLWDIKGESEFYRIPPVYLAGSDGYVLVADGTRRASVEHAMELKARVGEIAGDLPHVLLITKKDLFDAWEVDEALLSSLRARGEVAYPCSARGGIGVQNAMEALARAMWGVK
ncbi:MAG TPA: ADP-ribosylation factor-like protein [Deltaproteobacteria bacterium]|nr:ADP-ribosylation factor-like protein [Deltaproteobacteria bacterium]